MKKYYPIFLDITHKKCVVVGGGKVAKRKIKSLIEGGGDVTVISPNIDDGIKNLPVLWIEREYRDGDLDGAFIAISATNNSNINKMVRDEAEKKNILVNIVDQPGLCRFIVPSVIQRQGFSIAISTYGKDPSLAKKIRLRLEEILDGIIK